MIINGDGLIVGRVATVAAKKALLGEKIDIVNCENMVLTGKKKFILASQLQKFKRGIHTKGPFVPRMPDRFVRRMIRGMLPYKQARGKEAYDNIMCYIGVPESFKDKKMETIKEAHTSKVKNLNYMKVGDVVKLIGGNYE
jgi:large subunit ribosomal protein L13